MTGVTNLTTEAVARTATSREDTIKALQAELRGAMQIKDVDERRNQLGIINAKLEDVLKSDEEDTTNFSQSVRALDDSLSKIDLEIDSYERLEPHEQRLIDDAKAVLDAANAAKTEAQGAWLFKGSKIAVAETAIGEAEAALKAAERRANEMRDTRLMKADIKQSTDRYIRSAQVVFDQAGVRRTHADQQVTILTALKETTEQELSTLTGKVESLRANVEKAEAAVVDAQNALAEETKGTQAYTDAQTALRSAETARSQAMDERDKALGHVNALQSFLEATTTSMRTQEKMRRNLDIIMQIIETGLNKRVPLIEARLDTMKSVQTLQVARAIADVGDDIDAANARYAAQAGNVADEFVTDYLEKAPSRIDNQRRILAEQAENTAQTRQRIAELWHKFDEDYQTAA